MFIPTVEIMWVYLFVAANWPILTLDQYVKSRQICVLV